VKKRIGALFLLIFCLTSAVSCGKGTDDVYALVTALSESFGEDHGPSLMYSDKAAMGFTEVGHETLGRLYLGKWESPACASRIESFAIRLPLDDSGFEIHALKCVNASDTDEISGEEMIPDLDSPKVEDMAVANVLHRRLHHCLDLLPESERELIRALYFEDLTERQISKRTGVPQRTINDRRHKILRKLKKLLEN